MQKIFKVTVVLLVVALVGTQSLYAAGKANRKYVDAKTLTIINKAQDDGLPFCRIDASKYDAPKGAKEYLSYSTGLAVVFRSNSNAIHARWTTTHDKLKANMTPTFQSGLDLYIRENGEWIFAGIARTKSHGTNHEFTLVKCMTDGEREFMMYLPMFNGVSSLEIGVDEEATIEPIASPFKHKIMFVGSSITHGASASRPGACYVAHMGRALNAETPNIGLSGMCKLNGYFADIVCDSKADAFVFDTFSNSSAKQIEERLYNFVKRITVAHPGKPMIFLQTLKRDAAHFSLLAEERNSGQREAAEKYMAKICKEFKDVYFVNPGIYVGEDHEGTIDGTHPNDLGVQRTLAVALPKIKKILKKYGIK